MDKLKPCPFCGGEAKFFTKTNVTRGNTRGWEFGIFCTKCSVATPKTNYVLDIQFDDFGNIVETVDERKKAIEAWNRRADNAADTD